MTHTPGPWYFSTIYRPPTRSGVVDVFWGYSISGSCENGASILPTLAIVQNFPDQVKANARLISAAPDMLAELQQAVVELQEVSNVLRGQKLRGLANIIHQAANKKQAAINKAIK